MTVKIDGTNTVANPAFTGADTDTGLQCGTNELKLVTGGTARATVDSSGNVGIGLADPSSLLHLKTTAFPQLTLERDGVSDQGAGIKFLDGSGDENRIYGTDSSVVFDTGPSSTELARIQSGGGISFNGDTATANALNDYEEGSFVPTYSSGLTSPSYTGTGGHYTKIGNLVTVTIRIRATGTNASSHLQIAGLPFTSNAHNEGSFSFGYSDNISGSSGMPVMHVPENATSFHFYNQDGSNWDGNSGNGISGRTLHIRGFYYTNS